MNAHRLARAAAILDMPLIFTTSEEHGPNGDLLPTLKEIRPDAYEYQIDRHGIINSHRHKSPVLRDHGRLT
jgi:hypothetical protein